MFRVGIALVKYPMAAAIVVSGVMTMFRHGKKRLQHFVEKEKLRGRFQSHYPTGTGLIDNRFHMESV